MAECIRCGKEREDEHYMMCLDCFRFITGKKTRLPWEEAGEKFSKGVKNTGYRVPIPCRLVEVRQIKEGEATSEDYHVLLKVLCNSTLKYTHLYYRKVDEKVYPNRLEAEKAAGHKHSIGVSACKHIMHKDTMRPYKNKYIFEDA